MTSRAPKTHTIIPIRHPLNLITRNPDCGGSRKMALEYYARGAFTTWEVNARNIMQEINGEVLAEKEWALRDAIGIAYVPYNRVAFNSLPPDKRFEGDGAIGASFERYNNREDPFGTLLGGNGQFAGLSTTGFYAALEGIHYGSPYESASKLYPFSLVIAFGVDRKYFNDTSYGATGYFHRDDECNVSGEYYSFTFFKNQQARYWWLNSWQPTSKELEESGGWGKWTGNNRFRRVEWETQYPPAGCSYPP